MRAVLQRVAWAEVIVEGESVGRIDHGWLVYLGIEVGDKSEMIAPVAQKILELRGFADEQGKMNRSVVEVRGQILLVSQFTLAADTRKGNRPSFIRAAEPLIAQEFYELMCKELEVGL